MTQSRFGRPNVPMSAAEAQVLDALQLLPPSYEVLFSAPAIQLADHEATSSGSYEPDFVISGPNGSRLIVEVKSASSLSLANMVRFAAIDKRIRQMGDRFLLLAWGASASSSVARALPQFQALRIHFVASPPEVLKVVEDELKGIG